MFNKKNTFVPAPAVEQKTSVTGNAFLAAGMERSTRSYSKNGSDKFSRTDDEFVNQNTVASYRKPRTWKQIDAAMAKLWAVNPLWTVMFTILLRLISRPFVRFADGSQTEGSQNGHGMRHEAILRMMWIGIYYPETFIKNLHLFVAAGSWRDIFYMLRYELSHSSWETRALPWDFIGQFIVAGLENPNTSDLVKKWLPSVKANSNIKTTDAQSNNIIAKWLVGLLFRFTNEQSKRAAYKKYRLLKSSGTAHQWQQHISQGNYLAINFDTVAGRALSQMTSKNWLRKHGLEKAYLEWIAKKPVAKFTGFVHELFAKPITTLVQEMTINAQFMGLLQAAESHDEKIIVVRDTSGSMGTVVPGTSMTAFNIAKSMSIFFSYTLKGRFANHEIVFNDKVQFVTWEGTPTQRWKQNHGSSGGSTNLMGVFKLITEMRCSGIPEEDFPTTFLIVSDGQFNYDGLGNMGGFETTFARIEKLMVEHFSAEYMSKLKLVLWQMTAEPNSFETYSAVYPNIFYYGGFDPSLIKFLFPRNEIIIKDGKTVVQKAAPKNAVELFAAQLNQELLQKVEL